MDNPEKASEGKSKVQKEAVKRSLMVFLGAMAGTFLFLFLAVFYLGDPVRDSIKSAIGILISTPPTSMSAHETALVSKMVSEGKILPANNVLGTIISYYQSVIDMFEGLMALFGILAFFYIRSVSARDAEKMAEKAVKVHLRSGEFRDAADASFERMWSSKTEDAMSDLEEATENMDSFKRRTAALESRADAFDSRVLGIEERLSESGEINPEEQEEKG